MYLVNQNDTLVSQKGDSVRVVDRMFILCLQFVRFGSARRVQNKERHVLFSFQWDGLSASAAAHVAFSTSRT